MTADSKTLVVPAPFDEHARALLNDKDFKALQAYIDKGGMQLAPSTGAAFFELFLNGSDIQEIHRLNKGFPIEAIHWCRIKYDWDAKREEYIRNLQQQVRDKVFKAQMEATGLLADMLSAANRKHSDKLKKFLQTGDEKELSGALSVDTIQGLLKVVDALQKITGQDRVHKISKEETLNVNVNANTEPQLSTEAAAQILKTIADDKRRQLRQGTGDE